MKNVRRLFGGCVDFSTFTFRRECFFTNVILTSKKYVKPIQVYDVCLTKSPGKGNINTGTRYEIYLDYALNGQR